MVERLREDEWRRVRALRLAALADAPDAFGSTLVREAAFDEAAWRARLARSDAATFVATHGGRDAGLVTVAVTDGGEAGIYSVWVAPGARGAGLGDALMRAALSWAREQGLRRAVLDVGDANAPAIALYARHGFRRTGRRGTLPPPRGHVTEHEMAADLG